MNEDPWASPELAEAPADWIPATENGWGALVVWAAGPGNFARVPIAEHERHGTVVYRRADGSERSEPFLLTKADLQSIDDEIDTYLAAAELPPRPRPRILARNPTRNCHLTRSRTGTNSPPQKWTIQAGRPPSRIRSRRISCFNVPDRCLGQNPVQNRAHQQQGSSPARSGGRTTGDVVFALALQHASREAHWRPQGVSCWFPDLPLR